MGNNLSKELLRELLFYIPDNISWSDSVKDDDILDSVSEISSSINTLVHQTCNIQYEILKKLSILHGLSYILPNLAHWQQKGFFDLAVTVIQKGLLKNTKFGQNVMQGITESRVFFLDDYLSRIIKENSNSDFTELKWYHPNFIQFYQANILQAKRDMHMVAPFWISNAVNTIPSIPGQGLYAYGEFNFEYQPLKSKLTETYVRNLALSLQHYVQENSHVYGAALILKGKVPYIFLNWMRGKSPLDPSEIPDVEIIYSIPLIHKDKISDKEYWFTLKQGSEYRLKKANSKFIGLSKSFNKFHKKWDELRSYVVIDEVIKESSYDSASYESFVNDFWAKLNDFVKPSRQIPNSELKPNSNSELLVELKITLYKKDLEKETHSKSKIRSEKAKQILEKFSSNPELKQNILSILDKTEYTSDKLFYLDWNHIIYDQIKKKNYSKDVDDINVITSHYLDNLNDFFIFHRSPCFIRLDELDADKIKISVSKIPAIINDEKTETQILYYALFNVVLLVSQLKLEKSTLCVFWNSLLNEINLKNYKYFYWFYEKYIKRDENESSSISQLFKDFELQEVIQVFDITTVINLMESLKETLEQKKAQQSKINTPSFTDISGLFENELEEDVTDSVELLEENFLEENDLSSEDTEQNLQNIIAIIENKPLGDIITLADMKKTLFFAGYQYAETERNEVLTKLLNNEKSRYIYFFNYLLCKSNLVKFIYVIKSDDQVKVARERMGISNDPDRPTHSELANGQGIKAAGELIFQKASDGKWHLILINNGSGHYRPPALETLPLAKNAIIQKLNTDIITSEVKTLNSLKPGMTLASGWDNREDDFLYFDPLLIGSTHSVMDSHDLVSSTDNDDEMPELEEVYSDHDIQNSNLRRTEKFILKSEGLIISPEFLSSTYNKKAKLMNFQQNVKTLQQSFFIFLLAEQNHYLQHRNNVLFLINQLECSKVGLYQIICLERKQQGNHLGMSDVIALAKYLEQGNILLSSLQHLPIYYDALLYNAAKAKGIQIIGIEGKGLAYSKESPYYHQAREEYMAEQLVNLAKSEKNAIFLVGAAHISNLIKLLDVQGFRVDGSDASLGQNLITLKSDQTILARKMALSCVNTDLVKISSYGYQVESDSQPEIENLRHEAVKSHFFLLYINEFTEQLDLNWQVQKLLHLIDLWKFELIKGKYGITASFDTFRESNSDFRRSILLKLHPDKNPGKQNCNDDFIFVINVTFRRRLQ